MVTKNKKNLWRENFVFREFSIQHKDSNDVRQVTQMAYLSWPDHGVPESSEGCQVEIYQCHKFHGEDVKPTERDEDVTLTHA